MKNMQSWYRKLAISLLLISTTHLWADGRIGLLLQAIDQADAEIIPLLAKTADINAQIGFNRETPLMIAIRALTDEVDMSFYSWSLAPHIAGVGTGLLLFLGAEFKLFLERNEQRGKNWLERRRLTHHVFPPVLAGAAGAYAFTKFKKYKEKMLYKRLDVIRTILALPGINLDLVNNDEQTVGDIVGCSMITALETKNNFMRQALLDVETLLEQAAAPQQLQQPV